MQALSLRAGWSDGLIGGLLLVFVVSVWLLLPTWVAEPAHLPAGTPGPRFWPRLLLLLMAGLALVSIGRGISQWRHHGHPQRHVSHPEHPADDRKSLTTTWLHDRSKRGEWDPVPTGILRERCCPTIVAPLSLILYGWGLEPLGILPVSALLLAVLALSAGYQRYAVLLLVSLLTPCLLYLLFTNLAGLPLPSPFSAPLVTRLFQ